MDKGPYKLHRLGFVGVPFAIEKAKHLPSNVSPDKWGAWMVGFWGCAENTSFLAESASTVYWLSHKSNSDPSVIIKHLSISKTLTDTPIIYVNAEISEGGVVSNYKERIFRNGVCTLTNIRAEQQTKLSCELVLNYSILLENGYTQTKEVRLTGEDIHWEGYFNA